MNKQFAITLVNAAGDPYGGVQFYATGDEAVEAAKAMIRTAAPGSKVYAFQVMAKMEMTVEYTVSVVTP